ncbi:DUF1127 domain-containing protein [Modicisalibacter radicis]|uniref:DUF1127 domain-containing protein n=1 Tax=Halomonas sp. EAR18 TaxID=2518972 RepID=UPI001FCEE33E|nr:DUF1127 domain-containing protein [Halomonas sp. EAR18]
MALFDGKLEVARGGEYEIARGQAGAISAMTWLRRLGRRLRRWQQLHHERSQLWSLSDATLRDIGLSRADVEREASRSFWDDGGTHR